LPGRWWRPLEGEAVLSLSKGRFGGGLIHPAMVRPPLTLSTWPVT
jgi:hypothetical protein